MEIALSLLMLIALAAILSPTLMQMWRRGDRELTVGLIICVFALPLLLRLFT